MIASQVYIFIGQSGAGKGTQGRLLEQKLKDTGVSVQYLETGSKFREMVATGTFTAAKAKSMMDDGRLPPPFLGIHAWSHFFIHDYDGRSHLIVDGTPRVPIEAPILLSACEFYGWEPRVIFVDVSDEWAYDRTKGRGRADDMDEQDIWGRIQWFHESVVPTIEILKSSLFVHFHHIHGEQSIEAVHRDICRELEIS